MAEVPNKQIIFKSFLAGAPKMSDMELTVGSIKLHVPQGSGAVLVKNLYLSCDPYMRGRMREYYQSYIPPFVPGLVSFGLRLKCFLCVCFYVSEYSSFLLWVILCALIVYLLLASYLIPSLICFLC